MLVAGGGVLAQLPLAWFVSYGRRAKPLFHLCGYILNAINIERNPVHSCLLDSSEPQGSIRVYSLDFLCASFSHPIRMRLVSAGLSNCVQCPHSSMWSLLRLGI